MHSCPFCGQACYCNGDIDDIECDDTASDRCHHCDGDDSYDRLMIMPRGCIIGAATVTGWCDDPPEDNPWAFTSGRDEWKEGAGV